MNTFNFNHSMNQHKRSSLRQWISFSLIALVSALGIMTLISLNYHKEIAGLAYEKQALQKSFATVSEVQTQETEKRQERNAQQQKMYRIKRGADNPSLWLREIASSIPVNVRLQAVSRSPGKQLTLIGQAQAIDLVKQFVLKLKESKYLSAIKLQSIEPHSEEGLINFRIEGHITA